MNKGKFYTQAYVKKEVSTANKPKHMAYGQEHKGKTIEEFWHRVFFTNEFHVDPLLQKTGKVLREYTKRTDPDNIQEKPKKLKNKFHITGWIN
jgi:hypothetical protein